MSYVTDNIQSGRGQTGPRQSGTKAHQEVEVWWVIWVLTPGVSSEKVGRDTLTVSPHLGILPSYIGHSAERVYDMQTREHRMHHMGTLLFFPSKEGKNQSTIPSLAMLHANVESNSNQISITTFLAWSNNVLEIQTCPFFTTLINIFKRKQMILNTTQEKKNLKRFLR